ncbi:hypothetical protein F7725_004574 [Dissostichus mawsoni]|uniref:ZP domain-containing protein n=1 Tax=Dissostichus mawsoni TaxID=36200 RepID=A0A7J5XJF6_DISMA|nr:hypothetical protein F7725_004574 [Dissostichus mawsoni]
MFSVHRSATILADKSSCCPNLKERHSALVSVSLYFCLCGQEQRLLAFQMLSIPLSLGTNLTLRQLYTCTFRMLGVNIEIIFICIPDETGAYAITQLYAAQCGYSINVHPLPGHVELRASYFSCQTQNKDDEMFTFNFNLNVTQEGKEVTYPLNKTCSPSLPGLPERLPVRPTTWR